MTLPIHFRTIDLAQAVQISTQQVRNYEAAGFIPPAERSESGYRLYMPIHLAALKAVRALVRGFGWQRTLSIMQAVHGGKMALALALIDERHAELAAKRVQFEETLAALTTLARAVPRPSSRRPHHLRVGEAARQVGVRVSALHFWEQLGLLHPVRDAQTRYRLYDEHQMRRLRVVALLREAGYDFDAIRRALDEMATGQTERAIAAVQQRQTELARTSWECLAALALFHDYVHQYWPQLEPPC